MLQEILIAVKPVYSWAIFIGLGLLLILAILALWEFIETCRAVTLACRRYMEKK